MGALTGTLTYRQYYVEGDLPDGFREKFLEALLGNAFKEIDVESGDERRMGWVNVQDLLDADFTIEKFLFNQYLCVALREDVIRIPATTLRVYVQKEEQLTMKRLNREKLSKFERDEVKDVVKGNLKRKMLPAIRAVDLVWNLDARTVWFWSHNRAMGEALEELFERTFGLRLVPHNTYCSLLHAGLTERTLERVVAQEPADFVR